VDASGVAPDWLALREPADRAARSTDLLGPLREHLHAGTPQATLVIRDLGCGTGSMGRWLAGRLPGPQRWIMHDRDPELLDRAAASVTGPDAPRDAEGRPIEVATRHGDLTRLRAPDLAGTALVTCSALLDLLTGDEIDGLAAACAGAGCAALLTLSVAGHVEIDPAEALDAEIAAAFDAHQRRAVAGRTLLGPDAAGAAAAAFERHGARVHTRASPWRLGPGDAELTAVWLRGWVAAATEQRPDLGRRAGGYLRRRLDACAGGELRVLVDHRDLLAVPAPSTGGGA
jgi:hypothetical protein